MTCSSCGQGMRCTESRGTDTNRYRRYKCPFCDKTTFTHEREMDVSEAKKILWKLQKEQKEANADAEVVIIRKTVPAWKKGVMIR